MEKVLVTGCAGFIGMHFCKNILDDGYDVCGIDNINNYYNIQLKKERLKILNSYKNFKFHKLDICDLRNVEKVFSKFQPEKVVNLAAQAGVRYSLENPHSYIQSNIVGFINLIETCKKSRVEGLIYASSSSVYGSNEKMPFSYKDRTDKPISVYAASKRSNELIAHVYSHLYNLKTTGLRFFTVYGPWGRPDMAMHIFAEKIINEQKVKVFNDGKMYRDFTFIDDIVDGIRASMDKNYHLEIFNLGSGRSENILQIIKHIENELGKTADIIFDKIQSGDVEKTAADINYTRKMLDYKPSTSIEKGIPKFIDWYKSFYN